MRSIASRVLSLVVLVVFPSAAAFAQGSVCTGFEKGQVIRRLGGHTIAKKHTETKEELRALMWAHREELAAVLTSRGMGADVMDSLYEALRDDANISQRNLERGETFEWMAFRRDGTISANGPMCFAGNKQQGAWVVSFDAGAPPPPASCDLTASCNDGTLAVDASGSSDGVTVTMSWEGGEQQVISGQGKRWQGTHPKRYRTDTTFTARASGPATRTVTSYSFVIPQVCLNLALTKMETREEPVEGASCEESATVQACQAPPPSCSLAVNPTEVKAGDALEIAVTGHWDRESSPEGLEVALSDGRDLDPPFPQVVTFGKPGTYDIVGTAVNEAGEQATCRVSVEVKSRWTLRLFGAYLDTGEDVSADVVVPLQADPALTRFQIGSGQGLGASLEYRPSNVFGIEAGILLAQMDASWKVDLGPDWAMRTDDLGLMALTVGPNFHFTPAGPADVYAGPFVGFANYSEPNLRTLGVESPIDEIDSEFVWGAQLGVDVPFGTSAWGFHGDLRYLKLPAGDFDLDPLIGVAGLAYQF